MGGGVGVLLRQEHPQHRAGGGEQRRLNRDDQQGHPPGGRHEPAVLVPGGSAAGDEGEDRVGERVAYVEAGPGQQAAGLVGREHRHRHPRRPAGHLQSEQVGGDKEGHRGRRQPDRARVGEEAEAGQRTPAGQKSAARPQADQYRSGRSEQEAERDAGRAGMQPGHEHRGGGALQQDLSALHRAQAGEPPAALGHPGQDAVHGQQDHFRGHGQVGDHGAGGDQPRAGQLRGHERRAQHQPEAEVGHQGGPELRLHRLEVTVGLRHAKGERPRQPGVEHPRGEQQEVLDRADHPEPRGHQEPGEPEPEGVVQHGAGGEARDQDRSARGSRVFGPDPAPPGPAWCNGRQRPGSAVLADASGMWIRAAGTGGQADSEPLRGPTSGTEISGLGSSSSGKALRPCSRA